MRASNAKVLASQKVRDGVVPSGSLSRTCTRPRYALAYILEMLHIKRR